MRSTANHFQPSQHLSANDDNQFLLAPSRLTYSNNNGKDQLIKKLQQKNQRLMTQIQKIDKVLQQPEQKTVYGNKLPDIHSKVTQQQLQNAYKQIKNYQYEIKKLKTIAEGGSYVEQIKKLEATLKQKQDMSDRLKKQLAAIKKQSMGLVKSLKDDNVKQQYETKSVKLNTQIKWLRQKLREAQIKKETSRANSEKQLAFIKNIQKSLIQKGYPIGDLRILKQKFTPKNDNPNNSYYASARMTARQTNKTSYGEYESQKQQAVQDRTPQAYTSLKNEVKLLQKMQKDYQNQIISLQKQKNEATVINSKSRDRLIEVEDEIQKIQQRLIQYKKMIDPAKIKPTRGLSMPNAGRYGVMGNSMSTPGKSANFSHLYRNQQIGKFTRDGRRFTDRIKLGKCQSKIISIDFYQNNQGGNLVGLQATYEIKKNIKKGPLNMIHDQKQATKKAVTLFDNEDYFKQIQCVINQKNIVVGVTVLSNKGVANRVGVMQGIRRPLNIAKNQLPVCLYGSFTQSGIELLGTQVLQQKGN